MEASLRAQDRLHDRLDVAATERRSLQVPYGGEYLLCFSRMCKSSCAATYARCRDAAERWDPCCFRHAGLAVLQELVDAQSSRLQSVLDDREAEISRRTSELTKVRKGHNA